MDRTRGDLTAQAEDLLRLLAVAVNAVRLYPTTSPLRTQAIERFSRAAHATTAAHGPLPYRVDRERFILDGTAVGESFPQIAALAETLRALQVGQLIVAPGLGADEVARFLDVIGADAASVRASGGVRTALIDAGVENLAVIEVTLRPSSEEGLLGLDLTTAPTEDIARELQSAVARWSAAAPPGEADDVIATAIDRLELAARDLARRRCGDALLLLDEATRLEMLCAALPVDADGPRIEGLLDVVAHMPPAALARLLRLAAASRSIQPDSLLASLELPPELLAELEALLRPSPITEAQSGVPAVVEVMSIAGEVVAADADDTAHIRSLMTASTARDTAARALTTTMQMARLRRTEDSIRALAEALGPATREGALGEMASAAMFLRGLADDPALTAEVRAARTVLLEPAFLADCARRVVEDSGTEAARTLLSEAGAPGAEAVVAAYLEGTGARRERLLPVAGAMVESVAPIASRILRSGDAAGAASVLELLGAIGSTRLAPTIGVGLEHADAGVRTAAMVALAESGGAESMQLLVRALEHRDPETRRVAAREIGRTGSAEGLPALLRVLGGGRPFDRDWKLKQEVLRSIEMLHSPQAVPAVRRLARQQVVFGKKNRELRVLARRVLESLE